MLDVADEFLEDLYFDIISDSDIKDHAKETSFQPSVTPGPSFKTQVSNTTAFISNKTAKGNKKR